MHRLSLEELDEQSEDFDLSVLNTPGIDLFCSASDWILPAAHHLMPKRESYIYREASTYWAWMRGVHPQGFSYLEPLEASWGLASPLIGPDEQTLLEGLEEMFRLDKTEWHVMVLPGLKRDSRMFQLLVHALRGKYKLGLGEATVRLVAEVDKGPFHFLEHRSKQFRRSLRRSVKKSKEQGIEIVDGANLPAKEIYSRIQNVEKRAWKGIDEVGITTGGMHDFYQAMLPRLQRRGAHRVLFAMQDGVDLAYIFGGIIQDEYRGLQFSYDVDYQKYALGNLLQWEQIQRLCDEGICLYDLGTYIEYKERWADRKHETQTLLVFR